MKTALLFPGQGSQYVGMGRDLAEAFLSARERFRAADDLLGIRLSPIMFGEENAAELGAEALRQTEITQPALYVHSMAAMAVLSEQGLRFDAAAGHSLGEYSALAAAGAITFEDGLRVVRLRGELMAGAGSVRRGTMAAVLGMEDDAVSDLCSRISSELNGEVVQPANFNAPGQVVISGDEAAVGNASEALRESGARKVVPLPVSGAFHSPLMEDARAGLAEALEQLTIRPPACPVYLNVDAAPSTDPDHIRKRLLQQLTAPVKWSQTITAMQADGVERFIEVGAGNVLSGLARRIAGRDTLAITAGKADELAAITVHP